MRFTPRAVERLMRNGYIRRPWRSRWRYLDAGFLWLAKRRWEGGRAYAGE